MKKARRSAGLSQQGMAELVGLNVQVVKRMEKGVGSTSTLIEVMKALDFRLTGVGRGATLPEQLRANRLGRSLSLRETATRSGMSRATIAALERGEGTIASLLRLLSALAPKARRRAMERAYWGAGDKADRDSRFTPPDFMTHVEAAFGAIDLDPCAHRLSPVVARRRILRDEGGDGLVDAWSGRFAFVNPPFSELTRWLERAHGEWRAGRVATVVCLVPVRTDSAFFHDQISADADIYLLRGRIRFLEPKNGVAVLNATKGDETLVAEFQPTRDGDVLKLAKYVAPGAGRTPQQIGAELTRRYGKPGTSMAAGGIYQASWCTGGDQCRQIWGNQHAGLEAKLDVYGKLNIALFQGTAAEQAWRIEVKRAVGGAAPTNSLF